MTWIAAACGLVLVVVLVVTIYGASEIIRIPFLAVPYTPDDFGFKYEKVSFPSSDGLKLTGWFVPAAHATDATVIILHGLGSNAGDMLLNSLCLAREGRWNLFYINFRGHAESEGRWTSLGPLELRDFESGLQFLKSTKPEASKRLGLYGHSLGAAVAIIGAARHPELRAIVAESPFAKTSRTVGHFSELFYGIPAFPFMTISIVMASLRLGVSLFRFSPLAEIGKIAPRPLFMIHAERDRRMPRAEIDELFAAAGEPKELWIVPGAAHGEPWMVAKSEFDKRLVGFFRRTLV